MKPEHLLILIGTIYIAPTLPKSLGSIIGIVCLICATLKGMNIL